MTSDFLVRRGAKAVFRDAPPEYFTFDHRHFVSVLSHECLWKECISFIAAHPNTSCHDKRSSSTCKCGSTCAFLRCLEKKTNKQMVLNNALLLSDYVTKVMKRLSDLGVDPKVVLEFVF